LTRSANALEVEVTAITFSLKPLFDLTDKAFYELCRANPDVKFERTAAGELIVMSPTGGESGQRNANIIVDLGLWNRQAQKGVTFDSSTGFKLPNGADRSSCGGAVRTPDASWVRGDRWEALTPEQRRKFPPLAPDFVVELRSASDDLTMLQAKMQEYVDNGVRLGWLINPQDQQVEIYRPGQPVEVLQSPQSLSGEEVLPGFILDLSRILN
jgi:Uma2 family endonuclease